MFDMGLSYTKFLQSDYRLFILRFVHGLALVLIRA